MFVFHPPTVGATSVWQQKKFFHVSAIFEANAKFLWLLRKNNLSSFRQAAGEEVFSRFGILKNHISISGSCTEEIEVKLPEVFVSAGTTELKK